VHLDRANLVAPMANAERLIPYLEQPPDRTALALAKPIC
jgi:hypothetical protein